MENILGKNLTTLVELSKDLSCPKSKMAWYATIGIFKREFLIGSVGLYDRKSSLKRFKEAGRLQKDGFSLREIGLKFKAQDSPKGD